MSKMIAFINKKTLELIEVCTEDREHEITPNHGYDFYIVKVERGRPVPSVAEVEEELVNLRAKYPDSVNKSQDEDGKEMASISYGKYSELGFCSSPWEFLG